MKTNFYKEVDEEMEFFIDKLKSIGWKQEDTSYLIKRTDFITNPTARNEEWKYSLSLVLYPELLCYTNTTEIWIACKTSVELDATMEKDPWSSDILKKVSEYIKEELKKIEWKPFYDEDCFRNIFARPTMKKNMETIELVFYLNKDYPKGMWENHTL